MEEQNHGSLSLLASAYLASPEAGEFPAKRTKREGQERVSKAQAMTAQSEPRDQTRREDQESRLKETTEAP